MNYEALISAEPNLLYWWPLGDGTGTAQDLKGTNTGTYSGTYTLGQTGIPGSTHTSTQFNTGYVYTSVAFNSGSLTAMTYETWFKTTTSEITLMYFGTAQTGGSGQWNPLLVIGAFVGGTANRLNWYDYPRSTLSASATVLDGVWHHSVATITSTGALFYLDGALAGSQSDGAPQTLTGYMRLGDYQGQTTHQMVGNLAHCAVYSNALSAADVLLHYQIGRTPYASISSVRDPLISRIPGIN